MPTYPSGTRQQGVLCRRLRGKGQKEEALPSRNAQFNFLLIIDFREREREGGERKQGEGETMTSFSTYFCLHWLIFVCALTRDQTCCLGILGRLSNQLSPPTRARSAPFRRRNGDATRQMTMGVGDGNHRNEPRVQWAQEKEGDSHGKGSCRPGSSVVTWTASVCSKDLEGWGEWV